MIYNLAETMLDLTDGGQVQIFEGGPGFWDALLAGRITVDRLMGTFKFETDTPQWEMHPAGEEVLVCLSGALDVVLGDKGNERTVPLTAGRLTVVPRGVWHRFAVREPGELLFVTYGKGTEHRPFAG